MEKVFVLIPISTMMVYLEHDVPALVQVGYEQAICNGEGTVDFDDAIRMFIEDNYQGNGYNGNAYAPETLRLYATLLKARARAKWEAEYPNNRAVCYAQLDRLFHGGA